MVSSWFCFWGWPRPVADIYVRAVRKLNGDSYALRYGPSKMVWEGGHFSQAKLCLECWDVRSWGGLTESELEVVRTSLEELTQVDPDLLVPPKDYCGRPRSVSAPALYPPRPDVTYVRMGTIYEEVYSGKLK